ncbi:MAG: sulfate permease [Candidatus Nanopelagicales bacterium]
MAVSARAEQHAPSLGRRLGRLVPGLVRMRDYDTRRYLRGDLMGGVTVTAYLVPQVMAYSVLAGLQPQVGLYAIIVTLAIYFVLGTSWLLSVGPESTTALMTAAILAPLALGDPARYAALASTLALLVALAALLAWVLRLGFLADMLSKPVLVGYMAGVAVIMIASQLEKVTGVDVAGETFLQQIRSFVTNLPEYGVSWPTLALGLGVTVFLLLFARRYPRIPMPLVAVLLATAIVALVHPDPDTIKTVGEIPAALPELGLPSLSGADVSVLLLPAVGILVVGYADNVLTGRTFAARHRHRIDSNQELLALGAANVGSSLVRGFPVSSSASRSVIAEASGARTQVYSLVAIAGVVVVLLFLRDVLAAFPSAALGGLVIYAALRLVDVAEFRRLWHFRRREFALAVGATLGVLVFDILYGVLVAIALSIAELLVRVARPHDGVLGRVPGLAGWHDVDDYADAQQVPGLVVFRYDSPLFFANAEDFLEKCEDALDGADPPARWFLLNVEANVEVDITGLDAMEQFRQVCADRDVVFALARVKQDLLMPLERHGIAARIGAEHIYPTLPTAVEGYERWAAENPPVERAEPGTDPPDGPPRS